MSKGNILIVEDETIIRASLRRLLERNDFEVDEAGSVDAALERYELTDFNLIISDMRLPGAPGTELIGKSTTPVLIMTSYASLRSAVDSMKMGAVDYIAKPFDHDEMLTSVNAILARQAEVMAEPPEAANNISATSATKTEDGKGDYANIIGRSTVMQELFRRIDKVAPTNATVLIQGESGTGKELVAQALHNNSQRKKAPMISVNCAAIPETLIESELFGHEKGSFTGATSTREGLITAADGGTLFLDEIGELPLEAQARLLRVLQEGEVRRVGSIQSHKVNVRLIAATHRNLKQLSMEGQFREDLYFRLNVVELYIPPLRERGDDVVLLAEKLLQRQVELSGSQPLMFSPEALSAISQHQWRGNVRELQNAVERATILCEDDIIVPDNLGLEQPGSSYSTPVQSNSATLVNESSDGLTLEDYFQRFVLEHQDNMTETQLAKKLGISRKCLWERRQRLGIPRRKATATT
ncbi:sigma-54-dependent transcriptional regulator [Spongorhabdus nitratireducens]